MMTITPAQVLNELQHHIGRENGIHVRDLVQRITGQLAMSEPLERRVRAIVNELRKEGSHICGHPTDGYFMARTPEELDETCLFLYERAMTSLQLVSKLKNVALPDLRGQLHLPT